MSAYEVKAHPAYAGYEGQGANGLSDRIRQALGPVGAWLQQRSHYHTTLSELSALSDRDLADIGISRSDIPMIAREAAKAKPASRS